MKTISSQLYGLEAELDTTSETNGTTCFCVDNGEVYVAYGGIWYEQRGAYWKVGGAAESDLSGYARYIPSAAAVDDLVCFNAQDTGDRYVAYCGHWFKQPIPWSDTALLAAAAAQSPAELPAVTTDDNGDVLTVVSGAWAKAAPSGGGGGLVINAAYDSGTSSIVLDKTWQEIHDSMAAGTGVFVVVPGEEESDPTSVHPVIECVYAGSGFVGGGYVVDIIDFLATDGDIKFGCDSASGYPAFSVGGD